MGFVILKVVKEHRPTLVNGYYGTASPDDVSLSSVQCSRSGLLKTHLLQFGRPGSISVHTITIVNTY